MGPLISPRVLVRKILGRRGAFALRSAASWIAYRLGLYEFADSTGREDGVSALVVTYNDSDWLEPSLLSAKDLADEYVIVDSSTDETPEIARRVAEDHGLRVKMLRLPPGDIAMAREKALRGSSYKWLLVLDSDIILYESAAKRIKGVLEALDRRMHYLVYWKYLLFCGDLRHVCGENPYHVEHWLFTYSSKLTYRYLNFGNTVLEALIAPITLYKPVMLNEVLGVHLSRVRRPRALAEKHIKIAQRGLLLKYTSEGLNANKAILRIVREVYGAEDLEELVRLMRDMASKLPLYDETRHGPLPRVLREYIERNRDKYPGII